MKREECTKPENSGARLGLYCSLLTMAMDAVTEAPFLIAHITAHARETESAGAAVINNACARSAQRGNCLQALMT